MGSRHSEAGLLLRDGLWLILQLDGGGHWRLNAPSKAEPMVGCRVTLDGVRSGFNVLDVTRIERA